MTTLTLRPGNPATAKPKAAAPKPEPAMRADYALVGTRIVLQTRSPSRFDGVLVAMEGNFVTVEGEERRWLADGTLSGVVASGTFVLERGIVSYFLKEAPGA